MPKKIGGQKKVHVDEVAAIEVDDYVDANVTLNAPEKEAPPEEIKNMFDASKNPAKLKWYKLKWHCQSTIMSWKIVWIISYWNITWMMHVKLRLCTLTIGSERLMDGKNSRKMGSAVYSMH